MGAGFEKYLAAVVQAAPVFLNCHATVEKARRKADLLTRSHALESGVYVLMACGVLSPDQVPDDFPLKQRTVWNANGGSGIIGPDGEYLAGPIYDDEAPLYAEIDPQAIIREKWRIDTVGHYSRDDVVRFVLRGDKKE